MRPKVKDGEKIIAVRPVAIAGIIAYNDYLKDIDDPYNSTLEDLNGAEALGKAAADALWPPT